MAKIVTKIKKNIKSSLPFLVDVLRIGKNIIKFSKRIKSSSSMVDSNLKILQLKEYKNIFCGYYDHSPFNPSDENLILCHGTNAKAWRRPSPNRAVDILLVDVACNKLVKKLGSTHSWNWQQGARLQWLDSEYYIYNIFDKQDQSYKSVVGNIVTYRQEVLPIPVQESNGSMIYSFSYEALAKYRPDYGYRNKLVVDEDIEENKIMAYDREAKKLHVCVSASEIVKFTENKDAVQVSDYKFNHLLCSPDGLKVVFLFRYFVDGKRVTDLYVLDTVGLSWDRLLCDCGVSHFCWVDDKKLLFTGNVDAVFGYYQIDVTTKELRLIKQYSDGHPAFYKENEFITDTYPDKKGYRHLLHVDSDLKFNNIASFVEPVFFHGEMRCDLHPSLSPSKKFIQVDMAKGNNSRCVAIVDFDQYKAKL